MPQCCTKPGRCQQDSGIIHAVDSALSMLPGGCVDSATGFEGGACEPNLDATYGFAKNDSSFPESRDSGSEIDKATSFLEHPVTQGSVDKGPNPPSTSPAVKPEMTRVFKKEKLEKEVKQEPGVMTMKKERRTNSSDLAARQRASGNTFSYRLC